MRNLRTNTVASIDDNHETVSSEIRAELTVTADTFATGDIVTLKNAASDTVFNGIYRIANATSTTTLDVPHDSTAGNVTDDYDLTTNQWESVIIERGNESKLGEIRSGFISWDKGDTAGNVVRYDTDDDSSYLNTAESFITIKEASSSATSGDYFLKNNDYTYKLSLIYDGYQEGPLSDSGWIYNGASTRSLLSITIKLAEYSKRLTHVCLYRRDSSFDLFKLVKEIKTDSAWSNQDGLQVITINVKGRLGASYEARTGMSEALDTIQLKYGIATKIDGYLFAADCSHKRV